MSAYHKKAEQSNKKSEVANTSGTSKSSISRRFIEASEAEAKKVLSRRFENIQIPVLLIDGELEKWDHGAALGFGCNARR